MSAEIIVRLHHARAAQLHGVGVLCAPGIRAWFARYGLDYRAFIEHGLPIGLLEATGDAFALRACAIARQEAAHGRQ